MCMTRIYCSTMHKVHSRLNLGNKLLLMLYLILNVDGTIHTDSAVYSYVHCILM